MMATTAAPASAATTTDYEVVIGLEVHAQLLTASKMFCTCNAQYASAPPNTLVCPVCLGLPGTLPVINEQAVEFTVRTALALNCEIPEFTKFDRKNYNYPDLMKGYQISQYDLPLSQHGRLDIETEAGAKRIGITRVHLEEDVAKLYHRRDDLGETYSLMDVNRSGVPLMEIVGEPDLRSPEDAGLFLQTLRLLLRHLGVSTANMEDGAFRCDANISLRPRGATELGAKVEVKNMNSFRAVQRALAYEAERQAAALAAGERIEQETRGWVEERGVTVSQRSKEQAHDYRYFPEPDLPPLVLSREWVEQVRAQLPELPAARRRRFVEQYALSAADAGLLLTTRSLADYYEQAVAAAGPEHARPTANWLLRDVVRLAGGANAVAESKLTPAHLAAVVKLVAAGTISVRSVPEVLAAAFESGAPPAQIVEQRGLSQVSDTAELAAIVAEALDANPKSVADYLGGKQAAAKFLVGQVMRATRGKANPRSANELIVEALEARRAN